MAIRAMSIMEDLPCETGYTQVDAPMMLRLRRKGNGNGPVDASTGPFAFMVVKRMLSPVGTVLADIELFRHCRHRCEARPVRGGNAVVVRLLELAQQPRLDQLNELDV